MTIDKMTVRTRPNPDRPSSTVITDAGSGASRDLATRQRRYTITMAFRTACFVSMIFVPGAWRWVMLGAAVVLPYIAVLFANQSAPRSRPTPADQTTGSPSSDLALGSHETISEAADPPVRPS